MFNIFKWKIKFFGDEESTNVSVVKEFERFGTDIPTESGYVKLVNKKYVFETLENESKLYDEIELKKNLQQVKLFKEKVKLVKEI